jgi:hypothetical protein
MWLRSPLSPLVVGGLPATAGDPPPRLSIERGEAAWLGRGLLFSVSIIVHRVCLAVVSATADRISGPAMRTDDSTTRSLVKLAYPFHASSASGWSGAASSNVRYS